MSTLTALARTIAADTGTAQRICTVRHVHVSPRPLVFVPLALAGEANAPLAAMVGDDPQAPALLVVPEPRDRDQRFAFTAELGWIDPPPGVSGAQAAAAAEDPVRCPPAGPATDPLSGKRVVTPAHRAEVSRLAGTCRPASPAAMEPAVQPAGDNIRGATGASWCSSAMEPTPPA